MLADAVLASGKQAAELALQAQAAQPAAAPVPVRDLVPA
jgi:hypothetical protein